MFSRYHHAADQTLPYHLAVFTGERLQIRPQELPKGLRVLDDLLPMHLLLLGAGEALPLLLELAQLARDRLPPTAQRLQADDIVLIRIH